MVAPTILTRVTFATLGVTDITDYTGSITITRGRTSRLNTTIDAGTMSMILNNESRLFDPSYAAGTYFGKLVPGRKVEVRAGGAWAFTGVVSDWDLEYDRSGRSVAVLRCVDALASLARADFNAWTSSGVTADAKLTAICDRPEVAWPGGFRDFDAGVEDLQVDSVADNANVLNYAQQVAESDQGYLFASKTGELTFRNRLRRYGASTVTFGGAGNIQYQGIRADIGSEQLFSRVSVTRSGGVAQTAQVASLATWITAYGPPQSYPVTNVLLANDGRSTAVANYLLGLYDDPAYRISEVTIDLGPLSGAEQTTVLGLDISSVITVKFTPNGVGAETSQLLFIQGISHDIAPLSHRVTFSVVDAYAVVGTLWNFGLWSTGTWA